MGNKKKVINIHKCPKCRCGKTETTGNMVEYPDHYQKWWCAHCGWLVGLVDNSHHISCWAFKHNNFVIDF